MGAVNKTPNLRLSQFGDDDKPSWIGDYTSDMAKIEADHNERVAKENDLQAQIVTLQNQIATLQSAVTTLQGGIA